MRIRPNDASNVTNDAVALGEALDGQPFSTVGVSATARLVLVPRNAPLTRRQFEEANRSWATIFREDSAIEKLLNLSVFSADDILRHASFVRQAIAIACRKPDNPYSSNAGDLSTSTALAVGALVVDPASNSVLCAAGDARHIHPLRHAVMEAIGAVARSQQNPTYSSKSNHFYFRSIALFRRQSVFMIILLLPLLTVGHGVLDTPSKVCY